MHVGWRATAWVLCGLALMVLVGAIFFTAGAGMLAASDWGRGPAMSALAAATWVTALGFGLASWAAHRRARGARV